MGTSVLEPEDAGPMGRAPGPIEGGGPEEDIMKLDSIQEFLQDVACVERDVWYGCGRV